MFWRKVVGLISYGKDSTTVNEVELVLRAIGRVHTSDSG